jgi:hypothetical protein
MLKLKGPTKSPGLTGGAVFSDDEKYRYVLSRDWNENGNIIVWIMLNPSIGDDTKLERTTAGCMKRSLAWNFSGMVVINLFAYIATNPNELKQVKDPIGDLNNGFISGIGRDAPDNTVFVAAWGNNGNFMNRDKEVVEMLQNRDLYCLGITQEGNPRHPLHMSHSIRPELWCGAGDFHLWS